MKYEPGEIIRDKYVIIKLIGSGSFGTIYQGMSQNHLFEIFWKTTKNIWQISIFNFKNEY